MQKALKCFNYFFKKTLHFRTVLTASLGREQTTRTFFYHFCHKTNIFPYLKLCFTFYYLLETKYETVLMIFYPINNHGSLPQWIAVCWHKLQKIILDFTVLIHPFNFKTIHQRLTLYLHRITVVPPVLKARHMT